MAWIYTTYIASFGVTHVRFVFLRREVNEDMEFTDSDPLRDDYILSREDAKQFVMPWASDGNTGAIHDAIEAFVSEAN